MTPYQHILVGLDFSPASIVALSAAKRLAARAGSRITIINVIGPNEAARIKHADKIGEEEMLEQGRVKIRKFCDELGLEGFTVEARSLVGNPSHTLTRECARFEAALLILGSRGSERNQRHRPVYRASEPGPFADPAVVRCAQQGAGGKAGRAGWRRRNVRRLPKA